MFYPDRILGHLSQLQAWLKDHPETAAALGELVDLVARLPRARQLARLPALWRRARAIQQELTDLRSPSRQGPGGPSG